MGIGRKYKDLTVPNQKCPNNPVVVHADKKGHRLARV